MNHVRKLLCCLLGLAMAAVALSAVAGNDKKQFNINMQIVTAPPALAPFTVSAMVTNEGNSTINSVNLFVGGMTVVGVGTPSTGSSSFTASSVSIKNMHPLKSGDSVTVSIQVNSCGDGQWSGVGWSGSQLNGSSFSLDVGASQLATSISCGDADAGVAFIVPNSLDPTCVTGERGYYDKDGISRSGVQYFVTNTVPTNGHLQFRWPDSAIGTGVDSAATFEYTICSSGPVPAHGSQQVAWLNKDGTLASTPGVPDYIPALDCMVPKRLPAPYGTLVYDIDDSVTMLTVNALMPLGPAPPLGTTPNGTIPHAVPPFDIVIGSERMHVTAVVSDEDSAGDLSDPSESTEEELETEIWTVVRGYGNTHADSHSGNPLVMSTPLPIMTVTQGMHGQYVAGNQALMCVADSFPEGGGHATTIIDIGSDGHVVGP
jgi:hypothetical protein